jgi:hypothetical protein
MRKVSIPEDSSRKIYSQSHNSYVLEGVDPHQTTQVVAYLYHIFFGINRHSTYYKKLSGDMVLESQQNID